MDPSLAQLVVDLVEKMGLLRREIEHQQDQERYAARLARIGQKLSALAGAMEATDPARAAALRTAWAKPARSLAFRNAAHQKEIR
jgi:predicted DNA-binding helix-hairpin-helix protein